MNANAANGNAAGKGRVVNDGDYAIVETLSERQIAEVHALVQQQWWGGKRTLEDVRTMTANTSLMLGLIENSSGKLVGFCRVLYVSKCQSPLTSRNAHGH